MDLEEDVMEVNEEKFSELFNDSTILSYILYQLIVSCTEQNIKYLNSLRKINRTFNQLIPKNYLRINTPFKIIDVNIVLASNILIPKLPFNCIYYDNNVYKLIQIKIQTVRNRNVGLCGLRGVHGVRGPRGIQGPRTREELQTYLQDLERMIRN